MINIVILEGYMVDEPSLVYDKNKKIKTPSAAAAMVIERPYAYRYGKDFRRANRDFVRLYARGNTANILRRATKGERVIVSGELRQSHWIDKETGKRRYNYSVIVKEIDLLGRKPTEFSKGNIPQTLEQELADIARIKHSSNEKMPIEIERSIDKTYEEGLNINSPDEDLPTEFWGYIPADEVNE